jgi:ribosomal protein L32
MAVPKKKMSKARRNSRRTTWKKKVLKYVQMARTIGDVFDSAKLLYY